MSSTINALSDPTFTVDNITTLPPDYDPALPISSGDALNSTYSLTSAEYYDSTNLQTQLQFWIYDNTTGSLVVTDQAVFPMVTSDTTAEAPAPDAGTMIPATLDFLLSLIPSYTVKVSAGEGGMVSVNWTSDGSQNANSINPGESASFVVHGSSRELSLTANPNPGLYFQGWRINRAQTLNTTNPLQLILDPKNYPANASSGDPWGTKLSVTVEALFTNDIKASAGRANTSAKQSGGPQRMYVALGWEPALILTGRLHDDYTGFALVPLAVDLHAGFMPWNTGLGSFGIETKICWMGLDVKNSINDSTNKGSLMSFGLNMLWNIPLGSHFEIPISLGGGFGLCSDLSTAAGPGQYANNFLLDLGVGLRWLPWGSKGLFLGLDVDMNAMLENKGIFAILMAPALNLGWKF
jgi:hypothetical protein